nr:hypothetical protein [Tanacetum cinerariifolium]
EQGAGPNWLFDIDSLTKSMNYVPVDAGTISTNLSVTKDAANQEVRKNESSWRYILLPNWAHDALLESTSSKPYEESSSQVLEGSGNHNSTASTFNPSTEQRETLAVESPIPTASSPVPTACLNDSSETSSEARLVSKRVAHQEESPSLDNILSLTNRFDDFLGVSTSSDDIIGVEADVSNIETSISASPTPSLRIHKVYPKSQIISPVDTPIQTRHKSKMVEEQSFMATIHQKTDPALLQFCLYSCFLSQVEPKRVSDALNFKTMNKLVRHNLVRGLPSKYFKNNHTCAACLKGKQHKASCKTKLVHSVTKPLHTLHMDLSGPTSVSSLNHKLYCLVVTDNFSRFTWTLFLNTKDETSGILRNFITEIENLKDLKVKIIRRDNGGEFRNKEMNDLCSRKGIKREFSNARTPQQNGVAKRRNKTLIEVARTITPAIGFLKPFECHVMILNTLDNLGKFDAKGDEGYFIGYSMSSKAFRVFNKRTKRVEENLHVDFLENKLIEKGAGPNWLFDIDTLTNSMNYVPVVSAGTTSTNFSSTKEAASQDVKKDVSSLRYIALPNWFHEAHLESSISNAQDACKADAPESSGNSNPTATSTNPPADQMETLIVETPIPTFEDILGVTTNTGDTNRVEADLRNMENNISASPIPIFRIHKDHPTRSRVLARVYKVEKAMYGLHQAPRAWHQVTPKECHLHAVRRIFRYLKGHHKLELWYPKESPFNLVAYSDSDYGGATQD